MTARFEAIRIKRLADTFHDARKDAWLAVRDARKGCPIATVEPSYSEVRDDCNDDENIALNAEALRIWRVVFYDALRAEFERLATAGQLIDAKLGQANERGRS